MTNPPQEAIHASCIENFLQVKDDANTQKFMLIDTMQKKNFPSTFFCLHHAVCPKIQAKNRTRCGHSPENVREKADTLINPASFAAN
jgi:hypothetical protein